MDIQGIWIYGYSSDMDIWILRGYGYMDIQDIYMDIKGIWIYGYSGDMDIWILRGYGYMDI